MSDLAARPSPYPPATPHPQVNPQAPANPYPPVQNHYPPTPLPRLTRPQGGGPMIDPESVVLPPQIPFMRRIWKSRWLMHYNRLLALTLLINLAVAIYALGSGNWFTSDGVALGAVAKASLINLTVAIGFRQQYVVNLLFRIATSVPTSWPLKIRWTAGKVYHFGGIHVAGAVAGTAWFIVLLGSIVYHQANNLGSISRPLAVVSAMLVMLLVLMIVFSLPRFRAKYHDNFELMHRFGGWSALGLFWIHTVLLSASLRETGTSVIGAVVSSLAFWLLIAVTISIVLPWLRLKKVPVRISRPSNHVALVEFDHVTPFAGSSTTVSRNPLMEWHAFANVPSPAQEGFRLTISRAGDWTAKFIDEAPSHVWVKGIPTAGVGNVDQLFKRVVWVCTGSGIGPTLPHLLAKTAPAKLIWATRNPRKTYGDALIEEILEAQPDALLWDTDAHGKPDMVKLAYQAVKDFDAEAVITISNKKLTWQVVEGMERIGIPAYGAIWDS